MKIERVIEKMCVEKKSLREIAKELKIPKSTLHYRIRKVLPYVDDWLRNEYAELSNDNISTMSSKGGKAKNRKENKNG